MDKIKGDALLTQSLELVQNILLKRRHDVFTQPVFKEVAQNEELAALGGNVLEEVLEE
jgi:hypothetical protein